MSAEITKLIKKYVEHGQRSLDRNELVEISSHEFNYVIQLKYGAFRSKLMRVSEAMGYVEHSIYNKSTAPEILVFKLQDPFEVTLTDLIELKKLRGLATEERKIQRIVDKEYKIFNAIKKKVQNESGTN